MSPFFAFVLHCIRSSRFAAWLPGLPGPDPGNFLYAQKVTKKAPGRPWTPIFAQSVCIRGDIQLPLNFRWTASLLVIGAVLCRTSAVAPRADDCFFFFFADGSLRSFDRSKWLDTEPQIRLSLQKAVRRSWTRYPPRIRCQRAAIQWLCSIKSDGTDWAKRGPARRGLAVFSPIFGRPKMGPPEAKQR